MNTYSNDNINYNICPHCGSKEVTYHQAWGAFYCADCGEWAELELSEVDKGKEIGMKKVNLTPEIVALLTKEAYRYIRAFSYPEIHEVIHREKLVKDFIACFEPADSNSEVYERYNVYSRLHGWELNRSYFLNEYWVDTEQTIIRVWAKNKVSVRKYFKEAGYNGTHNIVLAKKFDKVAFINSLTN